MEDNVGVVCAYNGVIKSVEGVENTIPKVAREFYEVIRIIDGVPLFLEEHYLRMEKSLKLLGYTLKVTQQGMKEHIQSVVKANNLSNCNVKVIVFAEENNQTDLFYISKSYYPSKEEVNAGVPVSLLHLERNNPNVKQINIGYKEQVSREINEKKVFEVLLVNKDGKVTEGSKSNAFFIIGSKVYTAPGEYVLKGITRQYIIKACEASGLEVVEELLDESSLKGIDGLFISGTSIKVLPISQVDGMKFGSSTNPVIVSIRDSFDELIQDYIAVNR